MTDQPPVQPPQQPPHQPSGSPVPQPGQASPPTQQMPAASGVPGATPPAPPTTNAWRQATSTKGGRWAIGAAAGALAILMLLGIAVAGLVVLRGHDRFALSGQRNEFRRDGGQGFGRGPGDRDRDPRPGGGGGLRDGRAQGPGGLGGLMGGTALHGSLTATVNGTVQALVFQRGEVTAVSATSITLKSTDGFAGTYGRNAATTLRRAAPVKGGQAFVLARASDKVALTVLATQAPVGAAPTS